MYIGSTDNATIWIIVIIAVVVFVYIIMPHIFVDIGEKIANVFHDGQIKDKELVFAQSGRLADRYKHLQPQDTGAPANEPQAKEQASPPEQAPAEPPAASMPAADEPVRRKFCPYCGSENEYFALFCYNCGSALPDPDEMEDSRDN